MKTLLELLSETEILEKSGALERKISSVCFDSRKATAGALFVAIDGVESDGHDFINDAVNRGAVAIVYEKEFSDETGFETVTKIRVNNSRSALAIIARNFYDNPTEKLKLVGVTGTNGKTTTVTMLFKLFEALGNKSALLSTIENRIGKEIFPATHTTPDPITTNKFLALAIEKGCTHAFMECSSHAIDQKRISAMTFTGAIFTNLTQDHLDYHKTMESYAKTKKELFDALPETSFALSNLDDKQGQYMLQDTRAHKYFYSLNTEADFTEKLKTKLKGRFNAYNILSIYVTAILLGADKGKVKSAIEELDPPSGRLEFVKSKNSIRGVVDYAHTPDALENVLRTLREITKDSEKIITIVGCGGNRDTTKRPIMAKIATDLSDYSVFTADNPRHEDANKILDDMVVGLEDKKGKFECEPDRAKAVTIAVSHAKAGDIVLAAGKGHETYQIIGDEKIDFSDKIELEKALN